MTNEFIISAVYSRDYQRGLDFGSKYNCDKVYINLEEMAVDRDIDAVYIASPNALHFAQSAILLKNGKHVICEKPIVSNCSQYIELKNLADSKKLIYMEAIMTRHCEHYSKVHRAVSEIGKVVSARIDFSKRSTRLESFLSGEEVNIFDINLHAGTLMDLGIYCVWTAVDFFGMPKSITASASLCKNGADKSGSAIFTYDDFSVSLSYNKFGSSELGSEIIGVDGTLKIAHCSQYMGVTLIKGQEESQIIGFLQRELVMSGEAQRFADYILRFDKNNTDYAKFSEQCFFVHKCMDMIKQSAGIIYPEV